MSSFSVFRKTELKNFLSNFGISSDILEIFVKDQVSPFLTVGTNHYFRFSKLLHFSLLVIFALFCQINAYRLIKNKRLWEKLEKGSFSSFSLMRKMSNYWWWSEDYPSWQWSLSMGTLFRHFSPKKFLSVVNKNFCLDRIFA